MAKDLDEILSKIAEEEMNVSLRHDDEVHPVLSENLVNALRRAYLAGQKARKP